MEKRDRPALGESLDPKQREMMSALHETLLNIAGIEEEAAAVRMRLEERMRRLYEGS